MKKKYGKLLAVVMAAVFCLTLVPLSVWANPGPDGGQTHTVTYKTEDGETVHSDLTPDSAFPPAPEGTEGYTWSAKADGSEIIVPPQLVGDLDWYLYGFAPGATESAAPATGEEPDGTEAAEPPADPAGTEPPADPQGGPATPDGDPQAVYHEILYWGQDPAGNWYQETGDAFLAMVDDGENAQYPGAATQKPDGTNGFLGWYATREEVAGEAPFDFENTPITEVTELFARYSPDWFVYFLDTPHEGDPDRVLKTVTVPDGGLLDPAVAPDINRPEGKTIDGWRVQGGGLFDFGAPLTGNLYLEPNLIDAYHIHFLSYGTPVASQYVAQGQPVAKPADPQRTGYTFQSWVTRDAAGNTAPFNFGEPPTGDLILYGQWKAKEVNYTLSYWFEKANLPKGADLNDPANYELIETKNTLTAPAGSTVSVTAANAASGGYAPASDTLASYAKYHHSPPVEILGNGTSVVNVYYERKSYTVRFNLDKYGAKMAWNGKTYANSSEAFAQFFLSSLLYPLQLPEPLQ